MKGSAKDIGAISEQPYIRLYLALGLLILCASVALGQSTLAPEEPEYVDSFFALVDSAQPLIPLEAQRLKRSMTAKTRIISASVETTLFVPDEKSAVRFKTGQKLRLIVRVTSREQDPKLSLRFYKFSPATGMRVFYKGSGTSTAGIFGGKSSSTATEALAIPFTAKKYGTHSFEVIPNAPLEPGEYAVYTATSEFLYCFGIDKTGTLSGL